MADWAEPLYSQCCFFGPSGACGVQGKLHMTRFENEDWKVSPCNRLSRFSRPGLRGRGIGNHARRRELAERLGLLRIRAGAPLSDYRRYAGQMTAVDYVIRVVNGEIGDPTLSFQLRQGFHVVAVVNNYLRHDPESVGYAAVIEWLNPRVAGPGDYAALPLRFRGGPLVAGAL
jgi:hypothetical protein